ncbi:Imm50 family immunity protein [Pseudomonas synxantha]|uniref:Imm50 family immunity protein n=1 Tax=Pseudomonas synxantha TaxID=47883 RepID=UPI00345CA3BE
MKFWNEFDRSIFFNKVFSIQVPIGEIVLFSIDIDNNRSHITLAFDIPEIPDKPPEKWTLEGFNTCRIGLSCGGLSDVVIKNIPTLNRLQMTVQKHENFFIVRAESADSLIEFRTKYPSLCGPSVYIKDPDPACY